MIFHRFRQFPGLSPVKAWRRPARGQRALWAATTHTAYKPIDARALRCTMKLRYTVAANFAGCIAVSQQLLWSKKRIEAAANNDLARRQP